jgi:hypothetical protein
MGQKRRTEAYSTMKLFCLLSLCFLCLFIGCSKKLRIEIWNISNREITISLDTERQKVKSGSKGVFLYPRPGTKFSIELESRILEFTFKDPPPNYRNETAAMTLYKMQFSTNNAVYLIPAAATGPISVPERQPEGFPLRPKNAN